MKALRISRFGQKITMVVMLASVTALATLAFAFLFVDSQDAHEQLHARLTTLADVVGGNSNAALLFANRKAATEVLAALEAEPQIVSGCLYDRKGVLFARYLRNAASAPCPEQAVAWPVQDRFDAVSRLVIRGDEGVGRLVLRSDLEALKVRWRKLLVLSAGLFAMALGFGMATALLLQKKILRPVLDLSAAMSLVTRDQDFTARVPAEGDDEIAVLGRGFNAMLTELESREMRRRRAEEKLQYQAMNDELTGLPNRRLFADRLGQMLARSQRLKQQVAILYIDLDGFKLVNDSFGHAVGDALLAQVASRLRSRVRNSDTLARLGGDEFTVALCDVHNLSDAILVTNALLQVLSMPFQIEDHRINIGASIGISMYPKDGQDPAALCQHADSAMYAAKRNGKNGYTVFTPELGSSLCERLNLETELRGALARGEISIQFQPEFDVAQGRQRLVRFEALARWIHPTLGTISPAKFIPIAEETGLIIQLGAHVLQRACTEAVRWQALCSRGIGVAVNVSSLQFARAGFTDEVARVLHETGLPPSLLQLELTESIMLSDTDRAIHTLRHLSALGVGLAIDDFGTGYSSLAYLQRLPFNALKIDRSFVKALESRPESQRMVDSLITLAHNLNMRVIAEGVESTHEMEMIRSLGSDEVQGFLLGAPTWDPTDIIRKLADDPAPTGPQPPKNENKSAVFAS